jgi:hypothetical protein
MRHPAVIARSAGLKEFFAAVRRKNAALRKVFSKFGFQARRSPDPDAIYLA